MILLKNNNLCNCFKGPLIDHRASQEAWIVQAYKYMRIATSVNLSKCQLSTYTFHGVYTSVCDLWLLYITIYVCIYFLGIVKSRKSTASKSFFMASYSALVSSRNGNRTGPTSIPVRILNTDFTTLIPPARNDK